MFRASGVLIAAVLAALVVAAPAAADDAELWRTNNAKNPDVQRVGPRWERALKRFSRAPRRHVRALVRTSLQLERIAGTITKQFQAVQPSSSAGARIKKLILLTLKDTRLGYRLTAKAARNIVKGRRVGIRQARRADRAFSRTLRYDRRVVRAFKALGFSN